MMMVFSSISHGGEITKLAPPNMERGDCVMKAFSNRASTKLQWYDRHHGPYAQ